MVKKENEFYTLRTPAEYQQLSIALSYARNKLTDQIKEVKVSNYKRIKSSITEQMIKREALRQLAEMDSFINKDVLGNLFNNEIEEQAEADANAGEINAPLAGGAEGAAQIEEGEEGREEEEEGEEEEEEEEEDDDELILMLEEMNLKSVDELEEDFDEFYDEVVDMDIDEAQEQLNGYEILKSFIQSPELRSMYDDKVKDHIDDIINLLQTRIREIRREEIAVSKEGKEEEPSVSKEVVKGVSWEDAPKVITGEKTKTTKKIKVKKTGKGYGAYRKPAVRYSINKLNLMTASALAGNNNKELLKIISK